MVTIRTNVSALCSESNALLNALPRYVKISQRSTNFWDVVQLAFVSGMVMISAFIMAGRADTSDRRDGAEYGYNTVENNFPALLKQGVECLARKRRGGLSPGTAMNLARSKVCKQEHYMSSNRSSSSSSSNCSSTCMAVKLFMTKCLTSTGGKSTPSWALIGTNTFESSLRDIGPWAY